MSLQPVGAEPEHGDVKRAVRFMLVRVGWCIALAFVLHIVISAVLAYSVTNATFQPAALGRERIEQDSSEGQAGQYPLSRRVFTGRLWITGYFAAPGMDIVTSHEQGSGATPTHEVVEYRAGWPFRCWRSLAHRPAPRGTTWMVHAGLETNRPIDLTYGSLTGLGVPRSTAIPGIIPLEPVWSVLLASVGLLAGALLLVLLVPWMLRRVVRSRRGLCPACAYPIGVSDRCSECGTPVKARPAGA